MDPFERQFNRGGFKPEAIVAFIVGVVAAYIAHQLLGLQAYPPNGLFTMLIVTAVGGLWYQIRGVV
jgi:hypothetical protein